MKCFSNITCGMNREMALFGSVCCVETQTDPEEFETISDVSYESSEEEEIKISEYETKVEEKTQEKNNDIGIFILVVLFVILLKPLFPMGGLF